ncbi:MAG: ATP-binding protein [Planctomycetota bacterium]
MWLGVRASRGDRVLVSLRSQLRACLVLACVALAARRAAAGAGLELEESWRWRTFGHEDGLPPGGVGILYQDSFDHVYGASEEGIARYDLWEWARVGGDLPLRGEPVRRFVESFGTLYAVAPSAVWRMQGTAPPVLVYPGSQLRAAESPSGEAYVIDGGERKHLRLRKEIVDRFDPEVQLPSGAILDYQVDGARGHWLATANGLFARAAGQRSWSLVSDRELDPLLRGRRCLRLFRLRPPGSRSSPPAGLSGAAPWDELWALFGGSEPEGERGILARFENARWAPMAAFEGPLVENVVADSARRYYATSEDGRLRFSEDGRSWTGVENPGVGKLAVFVEIADSAGVVWFRTGAGDAAAFDPEDSRWENLRTGGAEAFPIVLSVAETDEGDVWIGTTRGLSRWRRGFRPENYESVHGVPLRRVTGIGQDTSRRVWISGESFSGAMCFNESTWTTETVPGFSEYPVRKIVKDRLGELWFLSQHRVDSAYVIYRCSRYTSSHIAPVRVPAGPVNDLVRAEGGEPEGEELWLATEEGLLRGAVDEGEFRVIERFSQANGLRSSRVFSVAQGPDGGIWVCYPFASAGVTRLKDGVARHFAVEEGLASPEVWSVAASGQNVWFGTDRGFSRFDGECWYNYSIASVDSRRTRVLPVVASVLETDSVIVGTWGLGAFRFRLKNRGPGPIRPRFAPPAISVARNPDGARTFSWDARDYRNDTPPDRLLFRSRIDQEPWSVFSTARSRTVRGCAPGKHLFRVEVRDLDGNRNRDDLACEFEVEGARPAPLFWALAAAAALAVAWAAVRIAPRVWARRRRRRIYERLARRFPGAVFLLDGAGTVLDAIGSERGVAGGALPSLAHAVGRPFAELAGFSEPSVRSAVARLLEGEPFLIENHRTAGDSGEERFVSVRGLPLGTGGRLLRAVRAAKLARARPAAAVIVEDRTARAEEARLLERTRRLGSLRGFAGRLLASLEEVLRDPALEDRIRGDPGLAEKLDRIARTLDRLAAFAGRVAEPAERTAVSMNDLVEDLIGAEAPESPLGRSLGPEKHIRIDWIGHPGLWPVRGDAGRLREALLELLENGVESIEERGTLTVRTANLRIEEDPGPLVPGAYVEVAIRDSGAGILPSEVESAFEPLYSTKGRDGALGVGLSVAYGIVRAHGGDVRLETSPGRGTLVRVLLPAWPGGRQ